MPFIISGPRAPAGPQEATLHLTAVTAEMWTATLSLTAITRPELPEATLQLTAEVAPVQRSATLHLTALTAPEALLPPGSPAGTAVPVEIITGLLPIRAEITVQGLGVPQEDFLDVEHAWTDEGTEELTATVLGVQPSLPWGQVVTVQARALRGDAVLGTLPTRSFKTQAQEPEINEAAGTTTFRFRNDFFADLRGARLTERIPWVVNPSDDPCLKTRRTVSVSGLVRSVMYDEVDPNFSLPEGDPLAGETFEEGRREYHTEGKTPRDIWDETYGRLGMVLSVRPYGAGVRLVGIWPDPISTGTGITVPEAELMTRPARDLRVHTPALLTLRGADKVTALGPDKLLEWVGSDPARQEIEREVLPHAEWIVSPPGRSGTATTEEGYLKTARQVVAHIQIITDDVHVQETIDGVVKHDIFRDVATGYRRTTTTFDPLCWARPIRQETVVKTWGYRYGMQLSTDTTPGPGLYHIITTGDLVASERVVTTFQYSPQGWQSRVTTSTERLASMKQENAEGLPEERGVLEGHEIIRTTRTEQWWPSGGGRWMYDPGTAGQMLLPVYDKETGEPVRTSSITRSGLEPPRVTDQAPPIFDCSNCETKDVHDETGVQLYAGDAGQGEEVEAHLDFLSSDNLVSTARKMLSARWHVREQTFTMPFPLGLARGDWLNGGRIRRMVTRLRNGVVDCEVTTRAPLHDVMPPSSAAVRPRMTDPTRGKSVMLSGKPFGARIRYVKGWNPEANAPIVEDSFVVWKTGYPPRPGDEIDWVLRNGVKEARNAR